VRSGAKSPARRIVTVQDFWDTGRDDLALELVAGEAGLGRKIIEAAINRPGLALSGFFEYFSFRRLQLMGAAEYAYLCSLPKLERGRRLAEFFKRKIPCVVVARNKRLLPEIHDLARKHGVPVFRTKMITKDFLNAATIIMENLQAPRMTVQGTMVEIMGIGVLIDGKTGTGKSEAALALIKRGHALVSDDITSLRVDSAGQIIAQPMSVTRYHMEIRGLGIIHVPSLFGVASVRGEKRLDLITTLCRVSEEVGLPCESTVSVRNVMGVGVSQITIPVMPGRDLANVLEAAALNEKLKRLGHDAVKELDEKLVAAMSGGKAGSE
jgi:HPr kinase/phosphorylase